jgi:hypothetical protein
MGFPAGSSAFRRATRVICPALLEALDRASRSRIPEEMPRLACLRGTVVSKRINGQGSAASPAVDFQSTSWKPGRPEGGAQNQRGRASA